MESTQTPTFTRVLQSLLADEAYRHLQNQLLERPDQGTPIPGARGLRKLRAPLEGRGKRGGFRVWYIHLPQRNTILFVYALPKNRGSDLTKDMERRLAEAVRKEFP